VTLDDLQSVADFPLLELAFKYGLVEFNTAIKAHAVTYAFDVLGGAKCLYFDNDVWVLRSLWQGGTRERHAHLQRLLSRPFSTRFG
jgi:hypothetical protein